MFVKKLFSHAATVFQVKNIEETLAFYQQKLGFQVSFTWKVPVEYAVLTRDKAVTIHLSKNPEAAENASKFATLYIFVYDVDQVYEEYQQNGVEILNPIGDRDYNMRDFDIVDNNGFVLTFGCSLDRVNQM